MTEETIDIELGDVVEKVEIKDGEDLLGVLFIHTKDGGFAGRLMLPEWMPMKGIMVIGKPPYDTTKKAKEAAVKFVCREVLGMAPIKQETMQ